MCEYCENLNDGRGAEIINDEHWTDRFNEEILEALEAYKAGDKEHTLQELAQCGAVILRMMEFVEQDFCKEDKC